MTKVSISIDVPDLQQGETFYCDALGCTKLRDQGDMCILSAGNTDIYLLKRDPGSQTSTTSDSARSFKRHWTPVHLDFGVDNVEKAVALILELGGKVEGDESGDWGAIAYCVDPFGHGFCLINE
jgi:predicted enzyme related to lactoylglutathione lyase